MKASSAPKISVIMSVYNGMPYLKEAVQSILAQTYKNFEFIIVDDASTDRSWQYLKSLKDKRLKLIKNKKNLGLAKSLNITLRQAQGDFVARMDADDVSLPQRLEKQMQFFKKNPSVDICGTWVNLIDENSQIIGEKKYPVNDSGIKKLLAWQPSIIHPTLMTRAKVLKELAGYDSKFDLAEEYELLMRAKNKFEMANLPMKLLKWRLWDKRRSRLEMNKMKDIDLKIKLESLRRDGLSILAALGLIKMILLGVVPYSLKLKIATFFKQA